MGVGSRDVTLFLPRVVKLTDAYSKHDHVQRFFPDYVGVLPLTQEEIRSQHSIDSYISQELNNILQLPLEEVALLNQDLRTGVGMIYVQQVINSIKKQISNQIDNVAQRQPEPESIAVKISLAQNLKNFFSTSFGWFTDMLSNVFSCFGVGDHNNHDDNIQNIEQMDAHSFSWSDLISNLSRSLLNTISYLSISLGIEQVRQEPAAEQRQDNLNLEVTGEEQEALL